MKKITLIAAAGMMALAAQAQYSVDPSTALVAAKGPKTVEYITLSDDAIADLEKAGAKVEYVGPAPELGRNLWYWEGTFIAGDESYPRVDMAEGGYISVEVTNVGWSGAGVAVDAPGVDLTMLNDNTHFHLAYFTPSGNGPASVALILLDSSEAGSVPAKIALGDAFNDGGVIYPTIAPKISDDWQGIDITFGDLKKIYPLFAPACIKGWTGNLFSFLGGGVAGQTLAFDAVYFYNTDGDGGVEGIAADADAADFVVTANTINVMNANGIELYNIAGQLVKATEGTTLGLTGLQAGVYVAKAANKVQKVVVR